MQLNILKSKIHKARITCADLNYEGSLAIDQNLMEEINLCSYERILVVNITNGKRLETYVIPGKRGSGEFLLNGAAAHCGKVGDVVTIMNFFWITSEELKIHIPKIIILNEKNAIIKRKGF